MAVAFVAEIPGMATEIDDRVMDSVGWASDSLPKGFNSHDAAGPPRVSASRRL